MTEDTTDRPLVTFALFAYNQEKYIREAVEGAFSQTYEPLEIILSDDCSSDRTYQIMQEMAAAYTGPHEVRVNRNAINRGLGAHINAVSALCRSEWLIVAAGDDISLPERTASILESLRARKDSPTLVHSSAIRIAEGGDVLGVANCRFLRELSDLALAINSRAFALGATVAWHRSLYDNFGPLPDNLMYEDQVFQVRALLTGGLVYIDRPLVKYRVGGVTSEHSKLSLYNKIFGVSNDRWIVARQQQLVDLSKDNASSLASTAVERQLNLCKFRRSMRDTSTRYGRIRLAAFYARESGLIKEALKHLMLSMMPSITQYIFDFSMKVRSVR